MPRRPTHANKHKRSTLPQKLAKQGGDVANRPSDPLSARQIDPSPAFLAALNNVLEWG